MIPELNKLCRTCLAPDKDLISIFDENESYTDGFKGFADLIGNLTNIMPKKSDGLPELVCLPCFNEIQKIHSFKMKCINSECILRKILEQTGEEKMVLHNDAVNQINELPCQTPEYGGENTQQISSGTSDFLIIKSEESNSSFYVGYTEEKQSNFMVHQEDHKSIQTHANQPMEVIIKEEPGLSTWSVEKYESEMEAEFKEAITDVNEENQMLNQGENFCEPYSQNHMAGLKPGFGEENTSVKEIEVVPESDKEDKSKSQCPKCHKSFMHLARLQRHIKSFVCVGQTLSNGQSVYTCSICGKKYNHQFSLQRHSLIIHKQKLTKEIITESTELGKGIQKEQINEIENQVETEVTQPINSELNSIEAMRQCNHCKEIFENDEVLARHKAMVRHKKPHPPEKVHICNICNKAFSFSHNLKIHLMHHKEIKPFKCEQCDQRFVRNSCLNRHLKTHTGDRPFTCEFCSKGFPYMYALKIHERSHTEERPYSCTICSMRFKFPNTLKEHHRTHTGEKPFACKLCPRRLSSKTNFRIHMRCHEKKNGDSVQKLITDSEKEMKHEDEIQSQFL